MPRNYVVDQPVQKPASKMKWIWIGLGVLLLLIILFFVFRGAASQPATTGNNITGTAPPRPPFLPSVIGGGSIIPIPGILSGFGGFGGSSGFGGFGGSSSGGGGGLLSGGIAPGGILNPINHIPILTGGIGGLFGRR